MRYYFPVFILLTFFISIIPAQDALNVNQISQLTMSWSGSSDIAVQGNYAFMASGSTGLRVLDISTGDAPEEVGYCDTPGSAGSVAIADNIAYVADWMSDLRIIDISTPTQPVEIGWLETGTMCSDVEVADGLVYVLDRWEGLKIVDASNPSNPEIISESYVPGSDGFDLEVAGDLAFVVDGFAGFFIINIQDPYNPYGMGSADIPHTAWGVGIQGNMAAVAGDQVYFYDISNPYLPDLQGSANVEGYALDVTMQGNLAYVAAAGGGFRVLNISIPGNAFEIGSLPLIASCRYFAVVDNHVLASAGGFHVIDITDPEDPILNHSLVRPGFHRKLCVSGGQAYVTCEDLGLRIVDISDPAAPENVAVYVMEGGIDDVQVAGDFAFTAGGSRGIRVVDVQDIEHLQEVAQVDIYSNDLVISGQLAYTYGSIDNSHGLYVLDISDPTHPEEMGFLELPSGWGNIAIQDDLAVAVGNEIIAIDISDPAHPQLLGLLELPASQTAVDLEGTIASIVWQDDGNGGLWLVDVSDPEHMFLAGDIATPGGDVNDDVVVSGNFAYLADGVGGLQVIDISDPANPVTDAFFGINSHAKGIALAGDYLTLVDSHYMFILDHLTIRNWHVSPDGSDDSGDGSPEFPFATIQRGIQEAADEDTVLVHPGTYIENLDFNGKDIVVISAAGPENTVINGNEAGSVVTFQSGEGPHAVLAGFTLTNGLGSDIIWEFTGGGVSCKAGSSPTLHNLVIRENHSLGGGGIFIQESAPVITHCVITENIAESTAGGIYNWGGEPHISFTEISHNWAGWLAGGLFGANYSILDVSNLTVIGNVSADLSGGGIYTNNSTSIIRNTIAWGNEPDQIAAYHDQGVFPLEIYYSSVQDGEDGVVPWQGVDYIWGEGNQWLDPLFVHPDESDYHLLPASPCIDAGDPASPLDPDGTTADMGAYFFNQTTEILPGDLNGDDVLNILDIIRLVNIILGDPPTEYELGVSDLNQDGSLNILDVILLVGIIVDG